MKLNELINELIQLSGQCHLDSEVIPQVEDGNRRQVQVDMGTLNVNVCPDGSTCLTLTLTTQEVFEW